MFDIDSLVQDILYEMSISAAGIDQFVIDTLINNYVIPAYNRDCPNVQTVVIQDTQRFYPYLDLTDMVGDKFLSHIYLILQDNAMYTWLRGEMGQGEADNLVTVASTDVVKKIVRMSYKSNSFVHSPMLLFDDSISDYYYSLDYNSKYVLIFTFLNNVCSNSIINPAEYETLKQFSSQKVGEFIAAGLDMSTIGVVNQYLDKVMESIRNSDTTNLFNPSVSSLSFGGEISIGFSTNGNLTQAVQQAIPMMTSAYKGTQDALRRFSRQSFKRYKNLAMKKFMWLYMV